MRTGDLILFGAAVGATMLPAAAGTKKNKVQDNRRPNIVVFYVDDMGWGDVGYHGVKDVYTPNIDALAHGGVTFTNGYVTSSVSGPSRAGLLSGCYQQRFGFYGNSMKCCVPESQPLFAELMKDNGYKTGMVGKWHGDPRPDYSPHRGFDFFCCIYGGHDYFRSGFNPDTKKTEHKPIWYGDEMMKPTLQEQGRFLTDLFTDEAVNFIDRNAEDPFFLYVAYNAPHHPWQADQKYLDQLDGIGFSHPDRKVLAGMVLAIDAGVGRIKAELEKHGQLENTLIFFLSDNGSPRGQGIAHPEHDRNKDRGGTVMSSPGMYRGFKGDTYEGGIRVPFLAYWKNTIPAGTVYDQPVMNIDVLPTAMAAIGAEKDKGLPFDGVNLLPYVLDGKKGRPHEIMYWRRGFDFAVRKGDWKLEYNDQGSTRRVQLFNLKNDPYEYHDLSDSHPRKADQLLRIFDAWDGVLPEYPYLKTEVKHPENRNLTAVRRSVKKYNHSLK